MSTIGYSVAKTPRSAVSLAYWLGFGVIEAAVGAAVWFLFARQDSDAATLIFALLFVVLLVVGTMLAIPVYDNLMHRLDHQG